MTHLASPDSTGARGPCATPRLVMPLDVWRDLAGTGRQESGLPSFLPFPRPREVDRKVPCPLPEAFLPAEVRGVIDCKPSKAPPPTNGINPRAYFS